MVSQFCQTQHSLTYTQHITMNVFTSFSPNERKIEKKKSFKKKLDRTKAKD